MNLQKAYKKEYLMVIDVGKKRDPTVIHLYKVVNKLKNDRDESRIENIDSMYETSLALVYIDELPNMKYDKQCRYITVLSQRKKIKGNCTILMDGTGVGTALIDMLRANSIPILEIIFTGSDTVKPILAQRTIENKFGTKSNTLKVAVGYNVGKSVMVEKTMVLMQQGRLQTASNLNKDYKENLNKQLIKFKGKVNEKTGNTKHENEKDSDHDDHVVCLLMASWWFIFAKLSEVGDITVREKYNLGSNNDNYLQNHI